MAAAAATGPSGKTAPQMEYAGTGGGSPPVNKFHADCSLRLLLLSTSLTALILLITSDQTELIPVPDMPGVFISNSAKFEDSPPALIYLMVVLIVICVYSILTLITSAIAVRRSSPSTKLLFHLVLLDMLMLGVLASATGAGGAIAYIGLKGNSHVGWDKICNIYGKFCRHAGSAIIISLVASIILVALVLLSSYSLYRRSR